MDLSKSDKKAARIIIDKGIQKEYETTLSGAEAIIRSWRSGDFSNREAYSELYQHVKDRDKHIARRYDGLGGSKYLLTVCIQYDEGIVSEEDLALFSEETREYALKWVAQWRTVRDK